jgi:hypothetical protein
MTIPIRQWSLSSGDAVERDAHAGRLPSPRRYEHVRVVVLCVSALLLGMLAFSVSPALGAAPWWQLASATRPANIKSRAAAASPSPSPPPRDSG